MLKYNIREPRFKEISECINVLYTAFGRVPSITIKEEVKVWKTLIRNEIGKFLISEIKGKIIGIGGIFLFKEVCSFGYMGVLPEYRGKGVGTEIFNKLFEIGKDSKYQTMILYASKLGEPIYKKFGFQGRFFGTMYDLPTSLPKLKVETKEIKVLNMLPDWLLDLDKKAMGFDRSKYLQMRINLGAKIIIIENEGYGLISNMRLGPLIATNFNTAIQIIIKSIALGANHLIIAEHQEIPKKIFESIKLTRHQNQGSLKMIYGKFISERLDLLYAIGTYAKG
ncbi:MAG: GNAT family N-acetyltransferase [Promethearchaeota archaeon]|nr:MAG: GNAT family N-acetyltransferase [Candidatus Lokiarchaeota archaeon]